jgi:hypothetical protein
MSLLGENMSNAPSMVVHTCNPSTQEAEAGGSGVLDLESKNQKEYA